MISTYGNINKEDSTHLKSVEVASCTVTELFSEDIPDTPIQGKLVIPEYQRPYVWGTKQISTLLHDLNEYFKSDDRCKPMYYLGSIILHQTDKGELNIIDGQQRITTLAIIQSLLEENKVPAINFASPLTIQNIKNNHLWFRNQLKGQSRIDFSKINITLIVTRNEDDAYTFFETQNTGGVRLSGADILKAHHLRAIPQEFKRSEYATQWEAQKSVEVVISYLLKCRYWNILNFRYIPSHRDIKNTKNQIIAEFSERTKKGAGNPAYQMVEVNSDELKSSLLMPAFPYSARQPLNNGINFISYLSSFSVIHYDLFIKEKPSIDNEFYKFQKDLIKQIDGTAYLKEFFEIALLIYVTKFGVTHLYEAALWIFRYTYSLRVSNQQTVREDSIPAFIKSNNFLFDHILSVFTHDGLIKKLESFTYKFDERNTEGNTVKSRFINRVKEYFDIEINQEIIKETYDDLLKEAIIKKIKSHG